jgi:hypothetical protein
LVWSRVQQGEITAEEARVSDDSNLILQALGDVMQSPEPGFRWSNLEKDDRILLCSDGLNSMLSDVGMQQILDFTSEPRETCQTLIKAANNAGGNDNITVILVDILEVSEITEQPQEITTKPKRKRWPKILLGMVIAGILVASLFFIETRFHVAEAIREKYKSISNSDRNNESLPDITDNKEKVVQRKTKTRKKAIDQVPLKEARPPIDTTLTINSLKGFLSNIEVVREKITYYREYDKDFYNRKKNEFESVVQSLDSLITEINKVAVIKADNSSVIKDGEVIDETFLRSVQQAIDNLNTKTENIITSPNKK